MKARKITAFVLALAMILLLAACDSKDDDDDRKKKKKTESDIKTEWNIKTESDITTEKLQKDIRITPTAAGSVQTEKYETADFSITIPKGWVVTTGGVNIDHSIRIYDPNEPLNQMFILLKAEILLHSQDGKNAWQQIYQGGNSQAIIFAKAPVLANPSTEEFYKIFSQYASFIAEVDTMYSGYTFPQFDNFTVTDRFASTSSLSSYAMGDELLRATFTDNSGREGEGMFSASVVDFGSFEISGGNVVDYQLQTADGGYYMAYNIVAITAAKDTFIEWESVLTDCMKTLQYSDSFVSATNQASNEQVAVAMQISQNFNQTMDAMMASWESRNRSQDILSQKQSDAILGYERVYDTETGDTYKATNGFTDVYDGERYQMITDDNMYSQPISGYIEEIN